MISLSSIALLLINEFLFQYVQQFVGCRHIATESAIVLNRHLALYSKFHILDHLACVKFDAEDALDVLSGLAELLLGEGPQGDGTEHAHLDALGASQEQTSFRM